MVHFTFTVDDLDLHAKFCSYALTSVLKIGINWRLGANRHLNAVFMPYAFGKISGLKKWGLIGQINELGFLLFNFYLF